MTPRPLRVGGLELHLTHCYSVIPIELSVSDLAQQAARTTLLAQERCLALELRSYSCSLITRSWTKIAQAHSRLTVRHNLTSTQGLCRHGSDRRRVLLTSFLQSCYALCGRLKPNNTYAKRPVRNHQPIALSPSPGLPLTFLRPRWPLSAQFAVSPASLLVR
jgi:hypothetical protein